MIEAIPMPNDCIVLIITKVSDPEELDTRFSKFSPSNTDVLEPVADHKKTISVEGADEVLDLFKRMMEQHLKGFEESKKEEAAVKVSSEIDLTRTYCFGSIEDLVKAAHILNGFYHGENRLYRNNERKIFYLVLSKSSHTPEEFNKVCNILTEYGSNEPYSKSSEAYMAEHYDLVMKKDALQKLLNA
jgi:adapter protein MecA 1/2